MWCGGQSLKSIEISNILEAIVNGIKFVPSQVLKCQQAGSLPSQLEVGRQVLAIRGWLEVGGVGVRLDMFLLLKNSI